jgi:hypothetical protein
MRHHHWLIVAAMLTGCGGAAAPAPPPPGGVSKPGTPTLTTATPSTMKVDQPKPGEPALELNPKVDTRAKAVNAKRRREVQQWLDARQGPRKRHPITGEWIDPEADCPGMPR